MINILKKKVKKLITDNTYREITPYTNFKSIGIYMIYIDNFNDDKIVPIYIGQTGNGKNRNFQARYKEHIKEIMSLNRLTSTYYKETLLSNFYGSSLKSCKIFKYMVDHNCTLKNFHMIIIDEVNCNNENLKNLLDEKEQEYFINYLPSFFGFNQINTLTEGIKLLFSSANHSNQLDNSKLLKYELEDSKNFIKYFGYGYTKFNYYHSFPKKYNINENSTEIEKELAKNKEKLLKEHFDPNKFTKYKEELQKINKELDELHISINNDLILFNKKYFYRIKEYCIANKIDIKKKFEDIKHLSIYQNKEELEKFEEYLKRKKIKTNILDILLVDENFSTLRTHYLKSIEKEKMLKYKQDEYLFIERTDCLLRLVPRKKYDVLPLKDMYKEFEFPDNIQSNNFALLNFEFSNHFLTMQECSLIKIDYIIKNNNTTTEKKNLFINCDSLTDTKLHYYEKNNSILAFSREPYIVQRFPDYISTSMEYQNGINDYTYKKYNKYDLDKILDEINSLIDGDTIFYIYLRPKMKSIFKSYIEHHYKKINILKIRLLEI